MKYKILELIRQNQHEKALNLLRNCLNDSLLLNEVILIESRFTNYTHRFLHKLLSDELLETEKNQLTNAMLSVLDKMPNLRNRSITQNYKVEFNMGYIGVVSE